MNRGTVVIVAWNQRAAAERCVQAVLENNPNEQIIFVDNCSSDGTREWLAEQTFDYVIFDEGVQEYGKVLNAVLENFEIAENLVLLSPRCQIGKETLHRMFATIESTPNVGVVGCRVNGTVVEQDIAIHSLEELYEMEQVIEGEDDYRVLGNSGFCYAMPSRMWTEVGAFDERLAELEGVLIDYQLRAVKGGYINKICRSACVLDWEVQKDTNIYEQALKNCDRKVLRQKWNMNYFNLSSNPKFLDVIRRDKMDKFSVLEIGCDMGANLLGIKNRFPNCSIYGVEINQNATAIGECVAPICYGNIEEETIPFEEKFDYIIFGDVLEHLHDPQRTIEYCREILKEDGRILASIPNVMHISVMKQLLRGEFRYTDVGLLDKTHIHFFTAKEIVRMFEQAEYTLEEMLGIVYELTEEEQKLEKELMKISTDVIPTMYETYQYIVVARV